MDEQLFTALVQECRYTLKAYMAEAERTCEMLNEYKSKHLDLNDRVRIMNQRSAENGAHHRYMHVRESLFDAVRSSAYE